MSNGAKEAVDRAVLAIGGRAKAVLYCAVKSDGGVQIGVSGDVMTGDAMLATGALALLERRLIDSVVA